MQSATIYIQGNRPDARALSGKLGLTKPYRFDPLGLDGRAHGLSGCPSALVVHGDGTQVKFSPDDLLLESGIDRLRQEALR